MEVTRFLEESPGVHSMARLTILVLLVLAAVVVVTVCAYVLKSEPADAGVVTALAGVLAAIIAQGAVAIINRNHGEGNA